MLRELLACVALLVSVSAVMVAVANISVTSREIGSLVQNTMAAANSRAGL